jgi:hypothetical protein
LKIDRHPDFSQELDTILDYIALDSFERALEFSSNIENEIKNIPVMPYKCRKSIHFNNDEIRDLIFKGYTITYFIDTDKILVLGILKYKETFLIKS